MKQPVRISAGPAEPPIGYCAPPRSASHTAPIWMAAALLLALAASWLAMWPRLQSTPLPDPQATAGLFKIEARCCSDADGNQAEIRP